MEPDNIFKPRICKTHCITLVNIEHSPYMFPIYYFKNNLKSTVVVATKKKTV